MALDSLTPPPSHQLLHRHTMAHVTMDAFAPSDQRLVGATVAAFARPRCIPAVLRAFSSSGEGVARHLGHNAFHLAGLVDNRGGDYERYRKSEDDIKALPAKVRSFYRRQNETLDLFKEVDNVLDSSATRAREESMERERARANCDGVGERDRLLPRPATASATTSRSREREDAENRSVVWIINVNLVLNIVLLIGKALVVVLSNSISLIASLIDSVMDLLSTIIIAWANRAKNSQDDRSIWTYPAGKRRLEPMGIVIFSVFMISSFMQVFVESIQRLWSRQVSATVPISGIVVMIVTILVKALVWIWCRKKTNSSVRALSQDAENDCVFNFFSLLFPFVGQKVHWSWLDAVGGLFLSVYIIYEWTETLVDNVRNLTGRRASPKQHQRIAYMVTRFSPLIKAIQHIHVYRAGDDHICEVDIIVPPETPLPLSHNVGETLQYALEELDGVVRAYVHIDFSANPMNGHIQR